MKLGSLFDGSGGFPLAGSLCGIEPVWAAEVEPYPIAVTRSRFPHMKHLGDVTKINGADIEPVDIITLIEMGKKLRQAGFRSSSHSLMCYVLIGYDGDSFEDAEKRLLQTMQEGFVPYAMLYRDENGNTDKEWRRFQREWCRPMIVGKKFREFCEKEGANS